MAKLLPSRKEAIYTLIEEARAERRRKRSFAKCSVALMTLGLDDREVIEVLHQLELCDQEGKPWPTK